MYHKSRSYDVWFLRYKVQRIEFFVIFLPFDPPNKPKKQNFEKIKKGSGDIIILHLCTTHDNHMMYGSWDIEHDRQNFFVILGYFLPLYLPNNPENQNFEKMKKTPEDIIILHMSTINQNHVIYDS